MTSRVELRVAVEEDPVARDLHVVEDDHRVHLVEAGSRAGSPTVAAVRRTSRGR